MNIEELFSLLLDDKPSSVILDNEDSIFKLIPELKTCKGFNQNNKWHIYDVYEHILHVVDNVPSDLVLRLAALFHDIGKPLSYHEDEQGIGHFYGHWEESQKIFDAFAAKHNLDKELSDLVSKLIYYHDINLDKLDMQDKFYKIFSIDNIQKIFLLKRADLLAQNPEFHYLLADYEKQKRKVLMKQKGII